METTLILEDADATAKLGRAVAPWLRAGDVVGLTGGLGAGKSLFARALIAERLAAVGRSEDIPSPSYVLVQSYPLGPVELWHADLYRLGSRDELAELGLEEAFASAICLIEWADRLGPDLPARSLMVRLEFVPDDEEARRAIVTARGRGWDWLPAALGAAVA